MIKIDMDMPETCATCPLEVYDGEADYYYCAYTDADVTQMRHYRHEQCPLNDCDSTKCANCKAKFGVNSCYLNREGDPE